MAIKLVSAPISRGAWPYLLWDLGKKKKEGGGVVILDICIGHCVRHRFWLDGLIGLMKNIRDS